MARLLSLRRDNAASILADFDSATAMLKALAGCLHGRDVAMLGAGRGLAALASVVNRLPRAAKETIYAVAGAAEAARPEELGRPIEEDISRWAAGLYPRRRYPAVAVGAANGAAVHLFAALGIPWLPQTFLVPVRHPGLPPEDAAGIMSWGAEPGRRLLDANPGLQLHFMHDPSDDWLMGGRMAYFRIKFLRLPRPYREFIADVLEPGGAIIVVDCALNWPSTRLGDRFFFQVGGAGATTPAEFYSGGPRMAEFLRRYGSRAERLASPEPDGERAEAEWGLEPSLAWDALSLAERGSWTSAQLRFTEPDDLSPLVAELYRARQRALGAEENRLIVESFALLEPYWVLRTRSAPFWLTFPTESSALALERYLDRCEPYDDIGLTLFSHGTDSIGLAPAERWRGLTARARRRGFYLGVDERRFPRDFAVFTRFQRSLKALTPRHPLPAPLPLREFERFMAVRGGEFAVGWLKGAAPRPGASPLRPLGL